MSKEHKKSLYHGRLFEYLSVKAELPSDALQGEFRLELMGRNLLFVMGCRRILEYSPCRITLAVKGFNIEVVGERLICSSYHDGTVGVEGRIDGVRCDDGEVAQ
jgi:sporulation protein YqfC